MSEFLFSFDFCFPSYPFQSRPTKTPLLLQVRSNNDTATNDFLEPLKLIWSFSYNTWHIFLSTLFPQQEYELFKGIRLLLPLYSHCPTQCLAQDKHSLY